MLYEVITPPIKNGSAANQRVTTSMNQRARVPRKPASNIELLPERPHKLLYLRRDHRLAVALLGVKIEIVLVVHRNNFV